LLLQIREKDHTAPLGGIVFSAYTHAMTHSDQLVVTDQTRAIARLIIGADLWLPVPAAYQDITVRLLLKAGVQFLNVPRRRAAALWQGRAF
jgi:hypothetical protein